VRIACSRLSHQAPTQAATRVALYLLCVPSFPSPVSFRFRPRDACFERHSSHPHRSLGSSLPSNFSPSPIRPTYKTTTRADEPSKLSFVRGTRTPFLSFFILFSHRHRLRLDSESTGASLVHIGACPPRFTRAFSLRERGLGTTRTHSRTHT